jgi:endonuclease YncB( thermonuclease family)
MIRGPSGQHPALKAVPIALVFAFGVLAGATIAPGLANRTTAPAGGPDDAQVAEFTPPAAVRATAGAYAVDVLRVLDGDTFEARVRVWPGIDITTKVRLRGIDAAEMRARCPEERAKAEAARDALAAMLREGEVTVSRVGIDKYGGRVDANAATRLTPDVSAAMLAKRLARAYDGGRRESWCAGSSS